MGKTKFSAQSGAGQNIPEITQCIIINDLIVDLWKFKKKSFQRIVFHKKLVYMKREISVLLIHSSYDTIYTLELYYMMLEYCETQK